MKKHGESVIAHMVKIGHGSEEMIRPRIQSGIRGRTNFLLPDGNVSAARAGFFSSNHTVNYHFFPGLED